MNMIWITTQFEGVHRYPDAPDDVSFLRNEHRHIFHVKVWIEIFHNDRDIEFIQFKRFINEYLQTYNFDYKSCEMISDLLYNEHIKPKYSNREVWIEISEDNENGIFKQYEVQ
jgi:hypothetical protein